MVQGNKSGAYGECNMNSNNVGKYQVLRTLNDFDQALIEVYGLNMTDARITRYEALAAVESAQGVRPAVLQIGRSRGWIQAA
jgi:hypothetical protein